MEIVKVDPKEFGIQESTAANIAAQFKPMLDKMEELEKEYNEVIDLDINDPETAKKAKEVRLKYVKTRTGTAAIHKEQKAFYWAGCKYVDGWKNTQEFASQGKESKLLSIEKHAENVERERLEKLNEARIKLVEPYLEDTTGLQIATMEDDVWEAYLAAKKKTYEDRIQAEKEAEEKRLAAIQAEKEEQERIRKENAKLKAEAEEREKKEKAEADKRAKIEAERVAKEEKERKEREAQAAKEKAAHDAELKKEREARAKAEAEERAKRAKIEAELKAKKEAEEAAKAEAEAKLQAELKKGDSDKVKDLLNDLESLKSKYVFDSKENKKMYNDVNTLIDKVINHIKK